MIYNTRLLRSIALNVFNLCERQAVNQRPLSVLNLEAIIDRVISENGGPIATDSVFELLVREAVDSRDVSEAWIERAKTALAEQAHQFVAPALSRAMQKEGGSRQYFVYSRWNPSGFGKRNDGVTEEVRLSDGDSAEMVLRWYTSHGDAPPTLHLGGMSWQLLRDWSDLLLALSDLASQPVTLEEVERLLLKHDFIDLTPSAHS